VAEAKEAQALWLEQVRTPSTLRPHMNRPSLRGWS